MRKNPFKIQEGTVRDARLNHYSIENREGDSVLFGHTTNWLGKTLQNQTIIFFYGFLILMFLTLFFRAFYLEVVQGAEHLGQSEGNRIRKVINKAPRGLIFDRFNRQLVYNTSHFYLYLNPTYLPADGERSQLQTKINNIIESDINLDNVTGYNPILMAEKLPYEQALKLMTLARLYPAIEIALEPTREYVKDAGLSHVIGYIGQITEAELEGAYSDYSFNDTLGKTGIELVYESLLRGVDGFTEFETDALGHGSEEISSVKPTSGQDITLTIDLEMQKSLSQILQSMSRDYGKTKSAGIVMNPQTGEILALVSMPDYDNNLFTSRLDRKEFVNLISNEDQPLFTRPIAGEYPPGSTFKIIMGSAGLQEGIIDDKFTVNSVGGVDLNGYFFPDWRPGGHGITNIYKAIADSVNTFFYIVGGGNNADRAGLGLDKINAYAKKFGLTKKLGIDLPSEAQGFLPTVEWKERVKGERWYLGDTYNMSIGQGDVLVTPLQMANYTSIIASGGKQIVPHLLKSSTNNDNSEKVPEQIDWLSLDNLNIMKQALRRTVVDGSATSLQSVQVPVSGKTGTAQFRSDRTPHSWFTGFAPYDNPELVVTIIVEEGGDQGLAVKAARLFLESIYNKK